MHRAEESVSSAGAQVQSTRSQCAKANPGLASQPSVGRRHERRGLLVASQDEVDLRAVQRFDDGKVLFAGDPEDPLDAVILYGRMRRSEPSYAHSFHVTAASKRHAAHPTEAGYRTALPKRRNFQTLQEHEGRITWPSRDALTIGANSTRLTCWQD